MSARVALVIPWFGRGLRGGAEQIAWQIATRLAARRHTVEVLTTTSAAFQAEWDEDHHRPGRVAENGLTVHRFAVRRRDRTLFAAANRQLLEVPANRLRPGLSPVDAATADTFVRENIHAPDLLRHLDASGAGYDAVVFLPYLYGPTLEGVARVADRAWLQPCLHDEVYAYLPATAAMFARARGLLFNSEGEASLAAHLYGPSVWARASVVGAGIEVPEVPATTPPEGLPILARAGDRFLLYLGRRDPTKNIDLLLTAFARFRKERPGTDLRLVLAGPGSAPAGALPGGAIDLGLVAENEKHALLASCLALVQPSRNESFSRVMMEAWAHGRPVVVHARCPATAPCVTACGGGFLAEDLDTWCAALGRVADAAPADLKELGEAGRGYAHAGSDWDRVIDRYEEALEITPRAVSRATRRSSQVHRKGAAVHQLLPTLASGDAIGNHARFLRDWLRAKGWHSEIFCIHLDPRLDREATPYTPGRLRAEDGVVYHHSIGSALTPVAVDHPGPKLLVHHNVTPPEFFAPYRPEFAPLLAQGRAELPLLAPAFAHSVGDSAFNAEDLVAAGFHAPGVLPIAVDPAIWREPPDALQLANLGDGARNLLFVGRIAPNKRQDHLIGLLAHLLPRVPTARLVLAGSETPCDPYASCLRLLAERLGVTSRVVFTGELSQAQLHACFRSAELFVSLSEHEGFGVPLVEAMWFDVPVLAYRAGAVAETLGTGGVLVTEKHWSELAALVERLLLDESLRARVVSAQRERRIAFTPASIAARYEACFDAVFGAAA